jgi:aconitate hydratase
LTNLAPGKNLTMKVTSKNGSKFDVQLQHTFNDEQIVWFKHGSALNYMKSKTH